MRRGYVSLVLGCGGLLLAASACLDDAQRAQIAPSRLLTDSVPADLVILVDPSDVPSETWFLSEEPSLTIGERAPEDPRYALARVTDARMLTSGQIAVADHGPMAVLLFDLNGEFRGQIGRRGDGPGEFRLFHRVRQCDDRRVFVLDMASSVMKVFSTTGNLLEQFRLFAHEADRPPYLWDCGDGSHATFGWGERDWRVMGAFRVPVPLAFSGEDGKVVRTLGWIPGPESYREEWGGGPRPLGAVTDMAMHNSRIFVAVGPEYHIFAFRTDGSLEWMLDRPLERRPADGKGYIESRRRPGMSGDRLRDFENRWRNHEFPELLPTFRAIRIDRLGNVWVEAYPAPGDERTIWSVFSGEGAWLSDVSVPHGLEVTDIGEDHLIGVVEDDLNVQRVLLFSLHKAPS